MLNLNHLPWLTLISKLLLATTAGINLFTLFLNYKNRQDSKKIQEEEKQLQKLNLISELQKQYYFLLFDLKNKVERNELKPSDYYRRYWIEREHEFVLFRNGFIDPSIYTQWINSEQEDYKSNETLNNTTYRKGYKQAKKFFKSRTTPDSNTAEFFDFMDKVFQENADSVSEKVMDFQKNN